MTTTDRLGSQSGQADSGEGPAPLASPLAESAPLPIELAPPPAPAPVAAMADAQDQQDQQEAAAQPEPAGGEPSAVPGADGREPVSPAPAAPAPAGAPRRGGAPWWAKLCVVLGALLLLSSGGTIAAIKLVSYRLDHAVSRQELLDNGARAGNRPAHTITGPLNFLLLGSDFRSRTPSDGQRSDTIIVVHVPRSLDRAYLISIPRDLRVELPPFSATEFPGKRDKINAAYQYGGGGAGGTQLLSATLTQLLGVRFDGAAVINFDGFRRAVDILGGVTLYVDHRVTAKHLAYDRNGRLISVYTDPEGRTFLPEGARPYVFEPGFQHMSGEIALEWTRTRYGLPNGDYDRQRNQQAFLRAMLAEAMSQDIVTNPVRLDQFIQAVGSSLAVDLNGVPLDELAFALRNVRPSTLVGVQVPSHPQRIGGVSYVIADDAASSLYQAIRDERLDVWALEHPTWVNRM